jgi:hypothetical protein
MPQSIELKVDSNVVTCAREADRPWFACPVPDSYFKTGATWQAVDPVHSSAWQTMPGKGFPSTPKEDWVRWFYGKPDIPRTAEPSNFMFFDYYPDASHGNRAATGQWNDRIGVI